LGLLKELSAVIVLLWIGSGLTALASDQPPGVPAAPTAQVVAAGSSLSAPIACERHHATVTQACPSRRLPKLEDGPDPASEIVLELKTFSGIAESPRFGVDGAAGTLFVVSQA
jgi:hypothetical protein